MTWGCGSTEFAGLFCACSLCCFLRGSGKKEAKRLLQLKRNLYKKIVENFNTESAEEAQRPQSLKSLSISTPCSPCMLCDFRGYP